MASHELSFAQVCDALRRNDESMFQLDTHSFPLGYGALLGEALVPNGDGTIMNCRVQDVTLVLSPLLNPDDTTTERSATLVLHFLQISPNLRRVCLVSDGTIRYYLHGGAPTADEIAERRLLPMKIDLARQMLLAVSQNSSIVVLELSFYQDFYCPMPEFLAIFRLPSLQELKLSDVYFPNSANSTVAQEAFHDAIVANTTIQNVALCLSSSSTIPTLILMALAGRVRLEKLRVTFQGRSFDVTTEHMQALVCLLSTTRKLQELTLSLPFQTEESMECLVEGLQANTTLQTLSLDNFCNVLDPAWRPFRKYMKSSSLPRFRGHSMQRLQIFDCDGDDWSAENGTFIVALFDDAQAGPLAADDSDDNDPGREATTVASTIKVLELTGFNDRVAFFQALLPVAEHIRLQGLAFRFFRRPSCPLLCECLPRLVHVRTLELSAYNMRYDGEAIDFVRAMKTNGSLHGVTINFGTVEECALTHRYQQLVQAYCQRNKALQDNFLASAQDRERRSSKSVGEDEFGDSLDCPLSLRVMSTAPSALDTALQAPRMAPNNMLKALVGLGERLVGECGTKRKRQGAASTEWPVEKTEAMTMAPKRQRF